MKIRVSRPALGLCLSLLAACSDPTAAPGGATDLAGADLATAPASDGGGDGAGAAGCQGLPLCEDFEGFAAGTPPGAPRWSVQSPNCAGTGSLTVDGAVARSGGRSLRVNGKGGYCNHVFLANSAAIRGIGKVVWGRFYLRLQGTLGQGHVTFLAMQDSADNSRDLRMGGQSNVLMWNRESDDATLPVLSPQGIARSVAPPPQAWRCVEFLVDGAQGFLQTYVDGAAVPGLQIDGASTPDVDEQWLRRPGWRPALQDLRLGWESYAGDDMTLWFDDIALSAKRIGC